MGKKTYVHVAKFAVADIFDDQYKAKLPDIMKNAASRAVDKSSSLTTKGDKKEEGFYLDGSLSKLDKTEKDGKTMIVGEVKLQMATWPKKSMFAFPSGSAKIPAGRGDRLDGAIEQLVEELIESVVEGKVVKEFEKRTK